MLKKIFAVLVVVVVILVGVWLFSGIEDHGQFVSVDSDTSVYPFGHCYLAVNVISIREDGTQASLMASITVTSPDGDVHGIGGSSVSATDDFCNDDWMIEILPIEVEDPTGSWSSLDGKDGRPTGELYTYETAVSNGHSEILTFTFGWR